MGEEGAGGEVVGVADEPELGEEEGELVLLVFQWNRQSQPNRPLPQVQTLPEEACDLLVEKCPHCFNVSFIKRQIHLHYFMYMLLTTAKNNILLNA